MLEAFFFFFIGMDTKYYILGKETNLPIESSHNDHGTHVMAVATDGVLTINP